MTWWLRRLEIVSADGLRLNRLHNSWISRSSVTRLNLVASGVGMTFVSEAAPRSPQVVVRNVADLKIEARAHLAWRADEARSPLIQSLRELTRAAVRGRSR